MPADAWMFLIGPVGAVGVVPVAVTVLAVRRRPTWAMWLGALLLALLAVSWLGYWVTWGWAFEYADALEPVPVPLEARQTQLAAATAVTTVALAVTAGTSLVVRRPSG